MTTEKYLELVNKAIENLKDNEDGYGQTPIDFMRKNGIKSTDNMSFFLDSVGAYLEEIKCGLLADIEATEAKKNGKSSVVSNVKKFTKKWTYIIVHLFGGVVKIGEEEGTGSDQNSRNHSQECRKGDHLFCIVPAKTKANAVKATLCGEIGEACPATILRRHENAVLYLDEDSSKFL